MNDLIKIAKECPSLNITVQAGELLEMVNYCVLTTRKEFETKQEPEQYITRKQAAQMLDVDLSSLWRWDKQAYLQPVSIGGKRRYKLSDINRILEKGQTV